MDSEETAALQQQMPAEAASDGLEGIAIVGMAGRFPGAPGVESFWRNLCDGVESVARFSAAELAAAGIPESLIADPSYVPARSVLADVDQFDAGFFRIPAHDADVLDPQHRIFMECTWEALESAGYDPAGCPGSVAVFAGSAGNTYFLSSLCPDRETLEELLRAYQVGSFAEVTGNEKDFLATRIAHRLNLRGPSVAVQTACSTSLVAICMACQSLQTYQCDMALAGGVSITFPQERGYLYQEGGLVSADGHCRAFDADARGTVFGSGAGVVVLKRLADAIADNDDVYAVIRGYAVNNDGADKASYAAPSARGQAEVIRMAHAMAGVSADSIGYVEAHGTGTPIGDPIEFAGLVEAFRATTDRSGFCVLGSVKPNVGHLDVAAGVTGLIKTVLALRHKCIPPTLHFRRPNPHLELAGSPFTISAQMTSWPAGTTPRRAGVSAFGVGGTNAHVVLEETPSRVDGPSGPAPSTRRWELLPLSARSDGALSHACANLAERLDDGSGIVLADAAYTLQSGRHAFAHRSFIVAREAGEAAMALRSRDAKRVPIGVGAAAPVRVAFLYPGQGTQTSGMGHELYRDEPAYRDALDRCAAQFRDRLGLDPREVLFSDSNSGASAPFAYSAVQPALFATEYALTQLWAEWGIRPAAVLGHSMGEYAAACAAGFLDLEDAVALLSERCRLIRDLPAGAMLAVQLSAAVAEPDLPEGIYLAADNTPLSCVLSGGVDAIAAYRETLSARGVACRPIESGVAFHSPIVEPVAEALRRFAAAIRHAEPSASMVSALTGRLSSETCDLRCSSYWANQMRRPVRFADAVRVLIENEQPTVLLEMGPGNTLAGLVRRNPAWKQAGSPMLLSSLDPGPALHGSEAYSLHYALGMLSTLGATVDWQGYGSGRAPRRRVALPTYPFERRRHWVEPVRSAYPSAAVASAQTVGAAATPASWPVPSAGTEKRMPPMPDASAPPAPRIIDRRDGLLVRVLALLARLTGTPASALDPDATFLELDLDSLFLTQLSMACRKEFGVPITFRNLLEDWPTSRTIAEYLDASLPPDALPPEEEEAATAMSPNGSGAPTSVASSVRSAVSDLAVGDSFVERVVAQQLELMARQLELLRDGGSAMEPSPPGSPAAVARPSHGGAPAVSAAPPRTAAAFGPFRPAETGPAASLTPPQRAYLADLIERYCARMPGSKRLTDEYRADFADPRSAAGFRPEWKEMVFPVVCDRSQGAYLWDVDGNRFLDVTLGFGISLFGHGPAFVTEALTAQLARGVEIGPQSPLAGKTARLLCELTGMERATFCNTGSEAVMAALRAARTVTGRTKVAFFTGGYHGTFDEVLARAGGTRIGPHGARAAVPAAPGVPPGMVGEVVLLEYGAPESLEALRSLAPDLAAVLIEPVQSRHPDLQPGAFLHEVRAITRNAGTALIFDEIITGFRLHLRGAQAWFGVDADMATYGKVIGGGLPIGVLAGTADFMDAFDGGTWRFGDDSRPEKGVTFFAGTFVRHPLALAAAWAVLSYLKEQGSQLQEQLNLRADDLLRRLNDRCAARRAPLRFVSAGSILLPRFDPDVRWAGLFYYELRLRGIHVWEGRVWFLSTAHTDADVATLVTAVDESLVALQSSGLLSTPGDVAAAPARNGSGWEADRATAGTPIPAVRPAETPRPNPVPTTSSGARLPVTDEQQEVWLAARMDDNINRALVEAASVTLDGALDIPLLRAAIQQVVDRHDALRSHFGADGSSQTVEPALVVETPLVDVSMDPDPAGALTALQAAEGRLIFDLERGPLFRAQIVRIAADRHVLLLTAHHLVCDGWSAWLILDEIGTIYASGTSGTPAAMEPAVRLADYLQDEAGAEGRRERAEAEDYWLRRLEPLPEPLQLPTDRARTGDRSGHGGRRSREMDADLIVRLRRFAATQRCTQHTVLMAVFTALVQRLSGADDFVVGVLAAGQSFLANPRLIGHCVHVLPMRFRPDRGKPVRDYLADVRTAALDAYSHPKTTFGRLIRRLPVKRDAGQIPLVSVLFNMDPVGEGVSFGRDIRVTVASNPRSFFQFDLGLNIVDRRDSVTVECDYNADLFDADTIDRWLGHFNTLLQAMIAAPPETHLIDLPLLTDAERLDVLVSRNQTAAGYPAGVCVHHLVTAQALHSLNAVAAEDGSHRLTYRDLEQRAAEVAGRLRASGVVPRDLVAVYVGRSADMLAAFLGVLKAGAAFVPLDPLYPRERLAYIVGDARPAALLTAAELQSELPEFAGPVVLLDGEAAAVAHGTPAAPNDVSSVGSPGDPAYVLYTSGSTGRPKGVVIPHRALVNLLEAARSEIGGVTENDVLVAATTVCFDIAVLEMFLPLICGARIVVASRDEVRDGGRLANRLSEAGATIYQATPAGWRLLIDAGWSGLPNLRGITGGEALPVPLAAALLKRCGGGLWNLYGPTETTIYSTGMRTAEPADARFIGRPLANTQAFVLDDARGPLPIGVAGELYLGGDGLADGYLNRPDETAERFVANPFAEEPGIGSARMYRTGDRVRWTRDGALEFLGRADDQVKLRGFRIELGEVEAALRAVPGVAEAAVAIWEPTVDDRRLVAYFVPAASGPGGVTPVDLRRAVESRLPAYMVPSRFIAMTGLPRTPNNKVDRRALPMPAAEEPSAAVSLPARIDPVSPPPIAAATLPPGVDADRRQQWDGRPRIQWTTTQRDLARIWRRILHIRTIDIEDSFFELGGHSLLAVRMLQEVATVFRVRVPVRTLFRAQTIVDLAAELELLITERRPSDSADTGEQGPPQVREHVRATGPVSDNAVPRFVVPIRLPSRSAAVRPPLFCLHHVYGVILAYRALARHLGNDQPVYGIQHPGVDGDDEGAAPDTTVEAMAARYVNAIRRLWPDGPYYLCGQSFGGVLAFEMARQLERDRLPVAFVGMLDTYAPTYFRTEEADLPERALLARLPGLLATTRSLPATERRDFWNSIVLNAVLRRLDPGHVAADDVTSLAGELAVIRARCMEAQRVYEATPLHIPVTLFRGVERLDMRTPDPHLWWDPLTPAGLHVVQVPGNHHSMMREPLVKRTAAAIRAAMDAAGAAASVATPSAEPDVASHRELASASR